MAILTAAEVIALLDLQPHSEGGAYRETFRDAATAGGRSHSSAIYYLLAAGRAPTGIASTQPRSGIGMRAESLGAWTLVGCTVAPGFNFTGFELAPVGWQPGMP